MANTENMKQNLKKYLKSILTLIGGTATAQGIAIVASPLLTRLYTPDEYGVLALYVSVVSVLVVVSTLKYELAIPLPKDDRIAKNIVILSIIIVIMFSFLLGLGIYLFQDWFKYMLHMDEQIARWFVCLLPFSLLGAGVYTTFSYWAVRKGYFRLIASTRIRQSTIQVFTQMICGIFNYGAVGLLIGDMLGRASGSGKIAVTTFREKNFFLDITIGEIKSSAKYYKKFPLLSTWASLLNSFSLQIPIFMCSFIFGPAVAGFYSLTQKIIGVPLNLIGQSVSQVYLNTLATYVHDNPIKLKKLFLTNVKYLLLLSVIPIVILIMFGPWIFEFVFGPSWKEAGVYLRLLGVMYFLQFVISPLSQTLNMLGKQHVQLMWDLSRFLLGIGVFCISMYYNFSPREAILLYGIIMSVMYVYMFFLIYLEIRRRLSQN